MSLGRFALVIFFNPDSAPRNCFFFFFVYQIVLNASVFNLSQGSADAPDGKFCIALTSSCLNYMLLNHSIDKISFYMTLSSNTSKQRHTYSNPSLFHKLQHSVKSLLSLTLFCNYVFLLSGLK